MIGFLPSICEKKAISGSKWNGVVVAADVMNTADPRRIIRSQARLG